MATGLGYATAVLASALESAEKATAASSLLVGGDTAVIGGERVKYPHASNDVHPLVTALVNFHAIMGDTDPSLRKFLPENGSPTVTLVCSRRGDGTTAVGEECFTNDISPEASKAVRPPPHPSPLNRI